MAFSKETQDMLDEFYKKYPKGCYSTDSYPISNDNLRLGYKHSCKIKLYPNRKDRYEHHVIADSGSMLSRTSYQQALEWALEEALSQIGIYKKSPPSKEEILETYLSQILDKISSFQYRKPSLIERIFGEKETRYTRSEWIALQEYENSIKSLLE